MPHTTVFLTLKLLKILFGAFSSPHGQYNGTSSSQTDDRRRKKILNALSASVLPLLMDPPLNEWNQGSLSIQQGIASILILSLEFTSVVVTLIEESDHDDSERLVQTILYALVSKAHTGHGKLIQDTAKEVIVKLAAVTRRESHSKLILDQCGMLFAEMLSRLRVPGGASMHTTGGGDAAQTFSVVFCLTWILEECTHVNQTDLLFGEQTNPTSTLLELVGQTMDRLDHHFLNRSVLEEEAMQLTRLYRSIFKFLKLFHCANNESSVDKREEQPTNSWLGLLSVFEKRTTNALHEDSVVDSEVDEEEPPIHPYYSSASRFGKASVRLSSDIIFRLCFLLSNDSLRVRIGACESLTEGFDYLGHGTRRLQGTEREEADIRNAVYRQVATSWPSIKARLSTVTDQVVEPFTPISSLLIVNATTDSSHHRHVVGSTTTTTTTTLGDSKTTDSGRQRFFLARLYTLIAAMFECSGDFMADRFGSSVWPIMAGQLEHLLRRRGVVTAAVDLDCSSPRMRSTTPTANDAEMMPSRAVVRRRAQQAKVPTNTRRWVDSERHLARAIFQCLTRVFSCKGSYGTVLVRIYQAVGLVVLPFLDSEGDNQDGDDISLVAMDAIKSILSHDADILFRPLLELSGRGIPPCPIRSSTDGALVQTIISDVSESTSNGTVLANRCQELLDFIATLPEQELE